MRLLWIATKPPWPPVDGGRLVQLLTIRALAEAGLEIVHLAPADAGKPAAAAEAALAPWCRTVAVEGEKSWVGKRMEVAVGAVLRGRSLALARHDRPEVRAAVSRMLVGGGFDLVHVEQVHALANAAPALGKGVPVVLRAQNVESDLWRGVAALPTVDPVRRWLARAEGRRLAAAEGRAVAQVAATVALTAEDAARLRALAPGARVEHVAAPFPAQLPSSPPLPGSPAVVALGSGGWLPNRDAAHWFTGEVWPAIHRRLPAARGYLFGDPETAPDPALAHRPAPRESADAFPAGAILVVPLRLASGVRMKILEAWARGVPVVATPQAAAGLGAIEGCHLLLGATAAELADAVARLAASPVLYQALVTAGRAVLAERHRPADVAARLLALYRELAA